jgi:hypothetical protein
MPATLEGGRPQADLLKVGLNRKPSQQYLAMLGGKPQHRFLRADKAIYPLRDKHQLGWRGKDPKQTC